MIAPSRFGGEMHRVNQQLNDFNADILPPPEYLVESHLIANLVARSPQQVDDHARKLNELKRQWRIPARVTCRYQLRLPSLIPNEPRLIGVSAPKKFVPT